MFKVVQIPQQTGEPPFQKGKKCGTPASWRATFISLLFVKPQWFYLAIDHPLELKAPIMHGGNTIYTALTRGLLL